MQDNISNTNNTLLQIIAVALLWVLLYQFNSVFFKFAEVIPAANLIFLPAMLRVVAVLICGWKAAIGLGVGAFLTMDSVFHRSEVEIIAELSINILGPLVGVLIGKRLANIPNTLAGLTVNHVVMFSILGGISNAIFHLPLQLLMHDRSPSLDATITMFAGDMIGCAIMLYSISIVMRGADYFMKKA